MKSSLFVPLPGQLPNSFLRMPLYSDSNGWWLGSAGVWSGIQLIFLVVLFAVSTLLTDGTFADARNIQNLLNQSAGYLIMGPLMVILWSRGGFDFSIPGVMGLSAYILVSSMNNGATPIGAALLTFLVALLAGLVNASLSGFLRLPGIFVTVGSGLILSALFLQASSGATSSMSQTNHNALDPLTLIVILASVAISVVVTIRSSPVKSSLSGKNFALDALKVGWPYVASAVAAGFAGIWFAMRLGAATPVAGRGFDVDVLVIVVLSGTWFNGYRPNPVGALFGILTYAIIINVLSLLGSDIGTIYFWKAFVILVLLMLQWVFHLVVSAIFRSSRDKKGRTAGEQAT